MDKFVIRGGNPLVGTVRVSGAKNAALPAMAAAILTEEPLILEAIPDVRDIQTERKLLESMVAEVELGYGRAHHRTSICCRNLSSPEAKYELVKTMRASTLVLGPLVARMGVARVSLPGGCAIGARPIDLHIKGLEKMGAQITQEYAGLNPLLIGVLKGACFFLSDLMRATELAALPSIALAVADPRGSAAELQARLRRAAVPIVARVADARVLLDLRSVPEADQPLLEAGLLEVLGEPDEAA